MCNYCQLFFITDKGHFLTRLSFKARLVSFWGSITVMLEVTIIQGNAEVTLASSWVTKPVIVSSTQPPHVTFSGHALLATAALPILGATRGSPS